MYLSMRKQRWRIFLALCPLALCLVGIILIIMGYETFFAVIFFFLFFFSLVLIDTGFNLYVWKRSRSIPRKPVSTRLAQDEAYDLLLTYFLKKRSIRKWTVPHSSEPSQIALKTSVGMYRFETLFPSRLTISISPSSNTGSRIELRFSQKARYAFVVIIVTFFAFMLLVDLHFILNQSASTRPFFCLGCVLKIFLVIVTLQIPLVTKIEQRRYFRSKIRRRLLKGERKKEE